MSGRDEPPGGARRPLERPSRQWPERVRPPEELTTRLNQQWRLSAPPSSPTPLRSLTRAFRLALAALLRPQQAFNATVVQNLNHLHETTDALRQMLEDVFVRTEVLFEHLDHHITWMDAVLDEIQRHQQASAASERRVLDGVAVMRDEHAQLRTAVGVLRHETQHLAKALRGTPAQPREMAAPVAAAVTGSPDALSHKYVGFEDEFRGSADAIRAGLAAYVPLFAGATDVLDVGCGRGEFLSLLRDHGIPARGIDLNEAMVEVSRERGFDASVADALVYLATQPDGSLGGLFAAQVVEHLRPDYLTQLLDTAFDKLRPGSVIVLETINPACWFAFFSSYIRDITHERPLHPDTLKYLLVASGFQQVEIRYSAPYPEHDKLQAVAPAGIPLDTANALNANAEKLNSLLFTYLDYAAIARR